MGSIAPKNKIKNQPEYYQVFVSGLLNTLQITFRAFKYVPWKDYKAVSADLKRIYQSVTEDEALLALKQLSERWDEKYPQISRSWNAHWHNLNTLFSYPSDIRKAIYTTNAIESLNSVVRSAVKKRKLFPSDESAKKVVKEYILAAKTEDAVLAVKSQRITGYKGIKNFFHPARGSTSPLPCQKP